MTILARLRFSWPIAAAWLALCLAGRVVGADAKEGLQPVLDAWTARQDRVRTFRFSWSAKEFLSQIANRDIRGNQSPEKAISPQPPATSDYWVSFGVRGTNRIRLERHDTQMSFEGDKFVPVTFLGVWDGEHERTLTSGDGFPLFQIGNSQRTTSLGEYIQVCPWALAYRPFHPLFGGLDKSKLRLDARAGVVGDHRCLILKHPGSGKGVVREIWVDPADDYVPVRCCDNLNGLVVSAVDIRYSHDHDNRWVPSSWTISLFDQFNPTVVSRGWTGKVTDYSLNEELPDSDFKLDIPPGTWVNDATTNEHYILKDGGKKRPIGNEFNGKNFEQLLNSEPRDTLARGGGNGWRVWLLAINIVVFIALIGLLLRRRRQRPTA